MTDQLVCDASAVAAVLLGGGAPGEWVAHRLRRARLAAPSLMPFEVANVLRRQELSAGIGADLAAQAHEDLRELQVELWPYDVLAGRVWELRRNLSSYDASYVALAELLRTPLLTVDGRLAAAPSVRCPVLVPPPVT